MKPSEAKEAKIFDRAYLETQVSGNTGIVRELLVIAASEIPQQIAALTHACAHNPAEIKNAAHKLKGASYNMGFNILGNLAREIELMTLSTDLSVYTDYLTRIRNEWTEILKIINSEKKV